jgi:hypothetical protein
MTVRLLDLAACTCAVSAPDPVHDAMLPYVQPYLVPALDHPDVVVTVECDAAAVSQIRRALVGRIPTATRTSHPQQRYHVWTGLDQEVLLPEHAPNHAITTTDDHIVLTADRSQVAATVGVRIIRQLIMRGGETADGRCVHAGAVDLDGEGVLIGGHPGAGKTSVLTHLVERHGARPVANDRTVLVPAGDRSWRAVGVPLAWRFTPEGIGGSPALSAVLADREPSRGRHLVDGKVELTPLEVSHALSRRTLSATHLTRIVVLLRSADRTPTTPDASFVRRHLDFGADDFFAEDWLSIRPRLAGQRENHWPVAESSWNAVASTVPIQVLSWADPAELPALAAAVMSGARS